jgi:hypothetical protein
MFGLHGLHSSVLHFSSLLIALFVSALLLKTSSVRGTWGIKVFFNPVNFYYIINKLIILVLIYINLILIHYLKYF